MESFLRKKQFLFGADGAGSVNVCNKRLQRKLKSMEFLEDSNQIIAALTFNHFKLRKNVESW